MPQKDKRRPLKPLRVFHSKLIAEPFAGVLLNIDRDLQRIGKRAEATGDGDAVRGIGLLTVFMRFATNAYEAVRYVGGDTPEDPRRKVNYVLIIAPVNRQLLDLLFSLVYMMDDFPARSLQYQRAGWRELSEEYHRFKTTFTNDPAWTDFFRNFKSLLKEHIPLLGITQSEVKRPSEIDYWKHPGELKDEATESRPFLRWLHKWLYADTSAQAHLSGGGLLKVSPFLIAEIVGGAKQELVENRMIQQYRFEQMSRTVIVTLAIATEINAYCKLGHEERIGYVWVILNDYCEEAKEMYEHRYSRLCSQSKQ